MMLDKYKADLIAQGKSANTVKAYVERVEQFLVWLNERYGETDPRAITHLDIREFKSYCLNIKKYAPSGVNQRLAAVRSYCAFLVSQNCIKTNPAIGIKKVKTNTEKKAPDVLTKTELNKFRREFYKSNNLRDIAIFEVLLNTGIRVSELVNIDMDDIEISDRRGILRVRKAKGEKYREVPLNACVREAINAYLHIRPRTDEKKLFIGERGPLTTGQGITRVLKKYADRVGLRDKIHPHLLRHQFATYLLREKKVDLSLVKELLGHEDINTTAIYTRPTAKEIAEAVEGIFD